MYFLFFGFPALSLLSDGMSAAAKVLYEYEEGFSFFSDELRLRRGNLDTVSKYIGLQYDPITRPTDLQY